MMLISDKTEVWRPIFTERLRHRTVQRSSKLLGTAAFLHYHLFALFSLILFVSVCLPAQTTVTAPLWCHSAPVVGVINRGCQCLHPDVFPCSHQCKSGLHQKAQKDARTCTKTHTLRPKQPQARHNDAPSDRMQPPRERKWLYPPKQPTYHSQALNM